MRRSTYRHDGFTLVELLVVIAIIGVLAGLLLPAVNGAREAVRKSSCGNKMSQLAKAVIDFEAKFNKLPVSTRPPYTNSSVTPPRRAGFVLLLPHIEQSPLYDLYQLDKDWNDNTDPNGIPQSGLQLNERTPSNRQIAMVKIPIFSCPSTPDPDRLDGDPQIKTMPYSNPGWSNAEGTGVATTDYSPILGVSFRFKATYLNPIPTPAADPGILSQTQPGRSTDVKDGMSTTIMYAESAGRPVLYRRKKVFANVSQTRVNGGGWARPASDFYFDGATVSMTNDVAVFPGAAISAMNVTNGEDIGSSAFNAAAPYGFPLANSSPLNPSSDCTAAVEGAAAPHRVAGTGEAFSFHNGGANFVFGDTSIRFLSQDIDVQVFAKLVTRNGREAVQLQD